MKILLRKARAIYTGRVRPEHAGKHVWVIEERPQEQNFDALRERAIAYRIIIEHDGSTRWPVENCRVVHYAALELLPQRKWFRTRDLVARRIEYSKPQKVGRHYRQKTERQRERFQPGISLLGDYLPLVGFSEGMWFTKSSPRYGRIVLDIVEEAAA